jgi:general secretion pathway protein M
VNARLALPAWTERWSALGQRERIIVGVGAGLLVAALLFAYAWLPIQRARNDLTARVPELRARLAVMKRDAGEIARLRSLPATSPGAAQQLDAQALRATFSGNQVIVTALDGRRFKLAIAETSYGTWIDELNRLGAASSAHVEEAAITALPQPGRVKIEAILSPSPSGAAR